MARSCPFKIRITEVTYHRFLVSLQTWQIADRLATEMDSEPTVGCESWGLDFGECPRFQAGPDGGMSQIDVPLAPGSRLLPQAGKIRQPDGFDTPWFPFWEKSGQKPGGG